MKNSLLILFAFSLISVVAKAETPVVPGCPGRITEVKLWRCGCRLDVKSADGTTNISFPLEMDGKITIFSKKELTGDCKGTILNNACNPEVLNGAVAVGTYNCIEVVTNGGGVTIQ